MGGYAAGGTVLSSVEAYDLKTKAWSAVPSMKIARAQFAAALGGDGRIYAIEGISGTSGAPTLGVEALDTSKKTWSSVASLSIVGTTPYPTPVALGGQDGRVYAFINGILTGSGTTVNLMIYDPNTGNWTPGTVDPTIGPEVVSGIVLPSGGMLTFGSGAFVYDGPPSPYSQVRASSAIFPGVLVGPMAHGRLPHDGGRVHRSDLRKLHEWALRELFAQQPIQSLRLVRRSVGELKPPVQMCVE